MNKSKTLNNDQKLNKKTLFWETTSLERNAKDN